jgi:hypothetical protein
MHVSFIGPWLYLINLSCTAMQGDVGRVTQDQLASHCHNTCDWLQELSLAGMVFGMVGLQSIVLSTVEAVGAVFREDGSHICSTRLVNLAVKLGSVSACRGSIGHPDHACHLEPGCLQQSDLVYTCAALQENAANLTTAQLAFISQRISGLMQELSVATNAGGQAIDDLASLASCTRLTDLYLSSPQNRAWSTSPQPRLHPFPCPSTELGLLARAGRQRRHAGAGCFPHLPRRGRGPR